MATDDVTANNDDGYLPGNTHTHTPGRFLDIIVPRRLMIAGVSSVHARARPPSTLYRPYTSFNYFLIALYPLSHFFSFLMTIVQSRFRGIVSILRGVLEEEEEEEES